MARDILSEYGPDHHAPAHSPGSSGLTTDGGKPYCKPGDYSPPAGPINQNSEGPGLRGGTNTGHDQKATSNDGAVGSSGLHGSNLGNKGSQGSY
jgi:hypothetical protein